MLDKFLYWESKIFHETKISLICYLGLRVSNFIVNSNSKLKITTSSHLMRRPGLFNCEMFLVLLILIVSESLTLMSPMEPSPMALTENCFFLPPEEELWNPWPHTIRQGFMRYFSSAVGTNDQVWAYRDKWQYSSI